MELTKLNGLYFALNLELVRYFIHANCHLSEEMRKEKEKNGWTAEVFTVEIGCRGFAGWSVRRLIRQEDPLLVTHSPSGCHRRALLTSLPVHMCILFADMY